MHLSSIYIYLLVALGGAIGASVRLFMVELIELHWKTHFPLETVLVFPLPTIFVNITGSLLIGIFATFSSQQMNSSMLYFINFFIIVGLLGGYTTFSSFSLQTVILLLNGDILLALANILISVFFCLIGVFVGISIGKLLCNGL